MEDIEYLDEYKDLVMPEIGNQSSGNHTSAGNAQGSGTRSAPRMRQMSSDSSSSSIDADIFQKLFHGKLTTDELWKDGDTKSKKHRRYDTSSSESNDAFDALYNRNVKKTNSKLRDRLESFDSIDDLGVALMHPITKTATNKPSTIGVNSAAKKSGGEQSGNESQKFKSNSIRGRPPLKPKTDAKKPSTAVKATLNKNGTFTSISSIKPSVSNTKTVTIIKPQKQKAVLPPKKDPLNIMEFFGETDSDTSYEYESDLYDDGDTDEETEHVIDISTDTSTTTSVADDVTPVVSEDESQPNGDNERLQLYLNNLNIAEAVIRTPISRKHNNTKKTRSSEKSSTNSTSTATATTPESSNKTLDSPLKPPTSANEQVFESKDESSANTGLEESFESTKSPSSSQKIISSSIAKNLDKMHVSPSSKDKKSQTNIDYDDSNLTYEKLERMSLDLAEQIMDIDAERTIEFQKRSGSKLHSDCSMDIVTQDNARHVRKLTYSNEQLNDDMPSGSNLRRVKSENFMPKRKRGKPSKVRAATIEETSKAKEVETSDSQHSNYMSDDKSNVNAAIDKKSTVPLTEKEEVCQQDVKVKQLASSLSKSKKSRGEKLRKKSKSSKLKRVNEPQIVQESDVHETHPELQDQDLEQILNEKFEKCVLVSTDKVQVKEVPEAQLEKKIIEKEIILNEIESTKLILEDKTNVDVHEGQKKKINNEEEIKSEETIEELTKNTEETTVKETVINECIQNEEKEECNISARALENVINFEEHLEKIPELEKDEEKLTQTIKYFESVNLDLPKSGEKDDLLASAHNIITCDTELEDATTSSDSDSLKPKILEEGEKSKIPNDEKENVVAVCKEALGSIENSVEAEDISDADVVLQKSVEAEETSAADGVIQRSIQKEETSAAYAALKKSEEEKETSAADAALQVELSKKLEAVNINDEKTSHAAELPENDEQTTDNISNIQLTDKQPKSGASILDVVISHAAESAEIEKKSIDGKSDEPNMNQDMLAVDTVPDDKAVSTAIAEQAMPGDLSGIDEKSDADSQLNETATTSTKSSKSRSSKRVHRSESGTPAVVEKQLRSTALKAEKISKTQDLNEAVCNLPTYLIPERLTRRMRALQKSSVNETEKLTPAKTETETQSTASNDDSEDTPLVYRRSRRVKFSDVVLDHPTAKPVDQPAAKPVDHPAVKLVAPSEQGANNDVKNPPSAKKGKKNVADETATQSTRTRAKKLIDTLASPKRETRNSSREKYMEEGKTGTKLKTVKESVTLTGTATIASTEAPVQISPGSSTIQIPELKTPTTSSYETPQSVRSCKKFVVRLKKTPKHKLLERIVITDINPVGTEQNIVDMKLDSIKPNIQKDISDNVSEMECAAEAENKLNMIDEELQTAQNVNDKDETPNETFEEVSIKQMDLPTEKTVTDSADLEDSKLVKDDTKTQAETDAENEQTETEIGFEKSAEVSIEESAEFSTADSAEVGTEQSAEVSLKESADVSLKESAEVSLEESAEDNMAESTEVGTEESAEANTEISAAEVTIESTIENCEEEQLSKRSPVKPNSNVESDSLSTIENETETIGVTANVEVQVEQANELNQCQKRSLRKRETEASSQSNDAVGKRKQIMGTILLKQQQAAKLKKSQGQGDQGIKNQKRMPPPAQPASSTSKALRKRKIQDELVQPEAKRAKLTQTKISDFRETLKGNTQYHAVMGKDTQKTQATKAGQLQAKLSDIKTNKKTIVASKKSEIVPATSSNTAEKKTIMRDVVKTGEVSQLSKSTDNVSKPIMSSQTIDKPRLNKKSLSSAEIGNRKSEPTKTKVALNTESSKHIVLGKKLKLGLEPPSRKSPSQTQLTTANKQSQPKLTQSATERGKKQMGHNDKKIEARKSEPSRIVKLIPETSDDTTISTGGKKLNLPQASKKVESRKLGTQTAPLKAAASVVSSKATLATAAGNSIEGTKVVQKSTTPLVKKGDSRKDKSQETQAAGVKFKLTLPTEASKKTGNVTAISSKKSEVIKKVGSRKSEPVKTSVTVAVISKTAKPDDTAKVGLTDPLELPNADATAVMEAGVSKERPMRTPTSVIPNKQPAVARENRISGTLSAPPIRFQTVTRAASSTRSLAATPTLLPSSDRRNDLKQPVADNLSASENFDTEDTQSGVATSVPKVAQEKQQSCNQPKGVPAVEQSFVSSASKKRKAQTPVASGIEDAMDTDQSAKRMNLGAADSIAFPVRITVASSHVAVSDPEIRATSLDSDMPLVKQSVPLTCRKLRVLVSRTMVKKWISTEKQKRTEPETETDTYSQLLTQMLAQTQPSGQLQNEMGSPLSAVCESQQVLATSDAAAASLLTPSPALLVELASSIEISSDEASMPNNYQPVVARQVSKNQPNTAQRMPLPVILPDLEIKAETNVDAAISEPQQAVQVTPKATVITVAPESIISTRNAQPTLPSASSAPDGNAQGIGTTKYFSFLYPQRYQRGLGEVGLDFCCPNLDGPMRAIDPTKLHTKIQVPVLELPQFVVMSTKIFSKHDSNIPNKVRAKLEQMAASEGLPCVVQTLGNAPDTTAKQPTMAGSVAAASAVVPTVTPTVKVSPQFAAAGAAASSTPVRLSNDALGNQMPRSTLAIKQMHPVASTATASLHPTLLQLPPICPKDKQRVELQTRVQLFDLVLQNLIKRASTLTVAEREATIGEIVRTSSLLPIDVDMGTKLLENYVHYLNIATHSTASTSLRLTSVVTPTVSAGNNSSVMRSMQGKSETPLPPAVVANKTASVTANSPPTVSKRQIRPIFGPDKNIIGYQCATMSSALASTANKKSQALLAAQKSAVPTNPSTAVKMKSLAQQQSPRNMSTSLKEFLNPSDSSHHLTLSSTASSAATQNINKVTGTTTSMPKKVFTNTYLRTAQIGKPPTKEAASVETSTPQASSSNRNVFVVNQMPQLEECILPDAVSNSNAASFIDLESSIKSEVEDVQETIS